MKDDVVDSSSDQEWLRNMVSKLFGHLLGEFFVFLLRLEHFLDERLHGGFSSCFGYSFLGMPPIGSNKESFGYAKTISVVVAWGISWGGVVVVHDILTCGFTDDFDHNEDSLVKGRTNKS